MSVDNPFQQQTTQTTQETPKKPEQSQPSQIYQIPVDLVPLPSKGLLYPLGHPLSNETHIEIRSMCANDEDLLTSRALIKNGTVISKLIQSCIVNKTIDPDSLLVGDRNAILLAIRITGYGSDYNVKITCPKCDKDFEHSFQLNGLELKPINGVPLAPNTNLFQCLLPSGLTVQYKLATGSDESLLNKMSEQKKKLQTQIDNSVTMRLLQSIVSMNGETDRAKIASMIRVMRAFDSRALRKEIDKVEPGVKMKQMAECVHCSEESEVDMPLGITFFWPDFRS